MPPKKKSYYIQKVPPLDNDKKLFNNLPNKKNLPIYSPLKHGFSKAPKPADPCELGSLKTRQTHPQM
jgi:hypothetical protein